MPDDHVLIEVAKGVTTELTNGVAAEAFSQTFTPERSYADWHLKLTDAATLHVDVVPVSCKVTQRGRGQRLYECFIDIGVRERFEVSEQDASTGRVAVAEVDARLLLLMEIERYFAVYEPDQNGRRLADVPDAVIDTGDDGVVIRTAYDAEMLHHNQQYTGIIRLKFRVIRGNT